MTNKKARYFMAWRTFMVLCALVVGCGNEADPDHK